MVQANVFPDYSFNGIVTNEEIQPDVRITVWWAWRLDQWILKLENGEFELMESINLTDSFLNLLSLLKDPTDDHMHLDPISSTEVPDHPGNPPNYDPCSIEVTNHPGWTKKLLFCLQFVGYLLPNNLK
ncbi:hypothetical protein Adt_38352 [Abeliophyllum distichum]|uniref:Uncharacterized protein n=1 Tax=Abeliophyllum distichum TaxID=126358 RepID=A0ABD1Q636_9LAMI